MTDEELFELVRNAYAEANKDYLAEQIEIAKQNIDDCDLKDTLTHKKEAALYCLFLCQYCDILHYLSIHHTFTI